MNSETLQAVPLITLVGPPNSGKTTLFNYLSGNNYKTVNYPGATVEYSVSKFLGKFNIDANLLDSPGIISLIPNSPDEKVSIDALYNHPKLGIPDAVVVTVDASQFSRHLFLAKQLLDSGFNVVIALTMVDILNRKGYSISSEELSRLMSCETVEIDGRIGSGIEELIAAIERTIGDKSGSDKKEPSKFEITQDKEELVAVYGHIEEIEQSVVHEIKRSPASTDIESANSMLRVLNAEQPPVKRKNNLDETTLKIDKILLNKFWGLLSFFIIMSITFTSIFWLAEPVMNLVDSLFGFLSQEALAVLGNNWLGDLIANGIINGTGSVMVFVPQILILFLILGLLEDTGYLARGAMLIDKPLSKIGLNGRSFVPMLSGFACAIPAMMAARTIPNKKERLLTIFIIPLMSCSARLPVYALLIAFLFPGDKSWEGGLMLAGIYIFSIASSVLVAGIMNKFKKSISSDTDNSSFILELPAYRKPKLSVVASNSYHSAKLYFKKAGPIILGFSIILWFLTYFPNTNPKIDTHNMTKAQTEQAMSAERLSHSYASDIGKMIQPVMKPLGLDWRVGVALISAFAAREVFVSSLALIFKVTGDESTLQNSMLGAMRKAELDDSGKNCLLLPLSWG